MQKLAPGTKLKVGAHEAEVMAYLAEGGFAHIYTVKYWPPPSEEDNNDDNNNISNNHKDNDNNNDNDNDDDNNKNNKNNKSQVGVLKRVIVHSKADLNTLRKEVDAMQKLSYSEHVVRLFDSNAQKLEDGTYEVLLLMEYCPNKSLLDYMNLHLKTKLNFEQITKIMYQISLAVYAMHSLKLIHRDLKIENVLIDSDYNFKLADFGSTSGFIAPPKTQEEFQTIANDIIHNTTPQYRAPEMIDLYKNIPIDEKSDIWALGVFLYKLLYYTTPFETQGELSILHGYYQFPPQPKYTSKLINLIIIMLQVNPQLRPNIYQVITEICKMIDKPVPVDDIYGAGPYEFDAYNTYQQQLQVQQQQLQQQQLQLQQQQYLQQQRYMEEQKRLHELQAQQINQEMALSESPPPEDDENKYLSEQPHLLAHSSKSSFSDLKHVPTETSVNEGYDDTNLVNDDDTEDITDPTLTNVEERFPDLGDLEEKLVEQKNPRISRPDQVAASLAYSNDEQSISMYPSRAQSMKSNISGPNPEHLGLKMAHTEAWMDVELSKSLTGVDVEGVFRRESTEKNEKSQQQQHHHHHQQQSSVGEPPSVRTPSSAFPEVEQQEVVGPLPRFEKRPVFSKKNSFDALFDEFGDENSPSIPDPQPPSTQASRNPFSSITPQTNLDHQLRNSINSHSQSIDVIKRDLMPEVSGGNPWAQYQTYQHNSKPIVPNPHSPHSLIPVKPIMNHAHFAEQKKGAYSQQVIPPSQHQPLMEQPVPQLPTRPLDDSAPRLPRRPQDSSVSGSMPAISPSIIVSQEGNLIDPNDFQMKTSRPQFNLDLLDLDVSSSPAQSLNKEKKEEDTLETKENNDTDTDSDGGLKVEEMKIAPKKKSSMNSTGRRSLELQRLNLDLQEMDLGSKSAESEEVILDDDVDRQGRRGSGDKSRRSLSLRRTSSAINSRSSSKLRKPSDDATNKRRSFLGF